MSGRRAWEGGYVHKDSRGRDVYVIRRQVGGTRYEVSTRCHKARAALVQLARFEADPERYDPCGTPSKEAIVLDKTLAEAFLTWSREARHNTRKWVGEQRSALAWWADELGGRDLRGLSLADAVIPALDGTFERPKKTTSRAHKIATLKTLYSWLRRERHLLKSVEDPMTDLAVPQSQPAQRRMQKEHTTEKINSVIRELDPERRRSRLAEE